MSKEYTYKIKLPTLAKINKFIKESLDGKLNAKNHSAMLICDQKELAKCLWDWSIDEIYYSFGLIVYPKTSYGCWGCKSLSANESFKKEMTETQRKKIASNLNAMKLVWTNKQSGVSAPIEFVA